MSPMKPMAPMKAPEQWWPEELGEHPNSAGGQNETRYAFFGDHKRLAVDTGDGKVQLYDTGEFNKVVDVGKSLSSDKRTTAKKRVPKGQGDRGDTKG
jgi:hypothetical protein